MTDQTKEIHVNQDQGLEVEETERLRERQVFLPRTDIYETKDGLVLVMDVPGADDRSVEVTLEKNVLTVSAYPVYRKQEGFTLDYAEYSEGDFQRSFALSDEIDRGKIDAKVKNGVLYLSLTKVGEAKPQKITVKAG